MQVNPKFLRRLPSKRLSARLLSLLAVVLLGGLLKSCFLSPLPSNAYPVLSTAEWKSLLQRYTVPPYHWLANGDVAYLKSSPDDRLQVCYQKMNSAGPIGSPRPGPVLPAQSVRHRSFMSGFFLPSPNEKWVACTHVDVTNKVSMDLVSNDGKTIRQITGSSDLFASWLPDSHRFLAISIGVFPAVKLQDIDSPVTLPLPGMNRDVPPLEILSPNATSLILGARFNGPIRNGGQPFNYPEMKMRSVSAANPKEVLRTWEISVPTDMDFGSVAPSPDGKRLLWTTGSLKNSKVTQLLDRILPHRSRIHPAQMCYFLSDIDGRNRHPIFSDSLLRPRSLALAWTPDSRHLSFIYKDYFYLVPVD